MVDVAPQSGRLSGFFLAKQSGAGVFTAVTNRINNTTFENTIDPGTIVYETLNGLMDSEVEVRAGLVDVGGKLGCPAWLAQSIPLLKGGIGTFVDSGAPDIAFGALAGGTLAGADTFTMAAPPPAALAGAFDWFGAWLTITSSGGRTEDVPVSGVSGDVVQTWKMVNTHDDTDVVAVKRQSLFIPPTGANRASYDYFTFILQYAGLFERQFIDAQIASIELAGDGERLDWNYEWVSSADLHAETESLTAPVTGTGEGTDSPVIMRDGGLLGKFARADTKLTMHNLMTKLSYKLTFKIQSDKVGGRDHTALIKTLASRMQELTWEELAGTGGKLYTIYSEFVRTAAEQPLLLAFLNAKTLHAISIAMPRAVITKFDPIGPTDNPVAWTGAAKPLLDQTSGIAVKIWVKNGVSGY